MIDWGRPQPPDIRDQSQGRIETIRLQEGQVCFVDMTGEKPGQAHFQSQCCIPDWGGSKTSDKTPQFICQSVATDPMQLLQPNGSAVRGVA
ncbi:MAG: hypothetical protein ER33_05245 [Cyanobium sp. CACIAM 14]|nr:MAG: hypothetical protein ER33_05245 [Cyanobium sp. CACIAM 14]